MQEYIYAVVYTSTSDYKDNIASPTLTSSVWWFNWEEDVQGGEKTTGKKPAGWNMSRLSYSWIIVTQQNT